MAKRTLNRKELRADYDAAEKRKEEEEQEEDEEEEEGDEDEEGDEEEAGDEEGEPSDEGEEEPKPKKVKKKAVVAKPKAKSRSRTAKITRMRVVWGVFNNSNQCVATYEYPRKQEAYDHAARLMNDKRTTHFVQPVKEPIEEKKEKE